MGAHRLSECGDCQGRESGHRRVSVTPIQDPHISRDDIHTGVKLQVRLGCATFM